MISLAHIEDNALFAPVRDYLNPLSRIEGFSEELVADFFALWTLWRTFFKEWEASSGMAAGTVAAFFQFPLFLSLSGRPGEPLPETFFLFGHSFLPRLYWQLFKNASISNYPPANYFGGMCPAIKRAPDCCAGQQRVKRSLTHTSKIKISFSPIWESSAERRLPIS